MDFAKKFFDKVIYIIKEYGAFILEGVGNTLLIAVVGTVVGLLIGIVVGVIKTIPLSKNPFLRFLQRVISFFLSAYVEIFRSTPMMVQAMVIYWGYAFLADYCSFGMRTLPLLPSALFIVSINTGAYIAEIVRGGILSVDKGQTEGAQAIGMNHFQTMVHVIIPQVLKNIMPAVGNEFVINIKDSSVLNVIGVVEIFYQATVVQKMTFATFEVYAIVCVVYFVITFTITRLLRLVEKLLTGKKDYKVDLPQKAQEEVQP